MSKLDRLGWAVKRVYEIEGTRVTLRATSAGFGEWLDYALDHYRVEPGDEQWFDDYSLVVPSYQGSTKRRQFCILYRGSSPIIRTLDPVTFGRALIEEFESDRYAERTDAVYLQALAMEIDGAYVLVPSFLASPLGRFGRKLDRSGVRLGRSTHLALKSSGQTAVISPLLELPPNALERLARLSPTPVAPDLLAPVDGRRIEAVFIHEDTDEDLQVVSRGRAAQSLTASVVNLRKIGAPALHSVAHMVAGTRCYGIGWRDARTALDAILTGARASSGNGRGNA